MSLDGYIAGPDGAVDFLVMDKETSELMAEFFATVDTAIMGRKTIEVPIKMTGGSLRNVPGKNNLPDGRPRTRA